MIKRFPFPPQQALNKPVRTWDSPLTEVRQGQNHDEDHAWIRWAFQSARVRCGSLMFQPKEIARAGVIAEWKDFSQSLWQPILAPAMLAAWFAATKGNDEDMEAIVSSLNRQLSSALVTRSSEAGNWLLESTRGAKYQGALGRLRQRVDEGRMEPHLPIVWATTAALFQLSPADMLVAEIGEEWHAAAAAITEPGGLLSFSSLAHAALRASNLLHFSEVPRPSGEVN